MRDSKIKRALISVTDKTGIVPFARALTEEFGIEIVSTGGTAAILTEEGIPVLPVDELTGFPEMMDGRIKTLHPNVHGGLLARRDSQEHLQQAKTHNIGLIDMVVVNLYAFEATVARADVRFEQAIENIDIGGPAMLRSAAKNHSSVTVVCDPESYEQILAEMRENDGATKPQTRRQLALQVFALTSAYDNAIYSWLAQNLGDNESKQTEKRLFLKKQCNLRYGENPHQYAEFYHYPNIIKDSFLDVGFNSDWQLAKARQLQGKELSYNNYLDLDAAWAAVREFGEPTVVIVKHLTPCGIASADSLTVAYQKAWNCDTVSAFGGVMAFNQEVPASLVQAIINNKQFIEALVAPAYEPEALELLASKANARVLVTGGINPTGNTMDIRSIEGGMLVMNSDAVREDYAGFTVPTLVKPDAEQLEDLMFAWRACKSVKSNAIVIASDKATVGIGAGQPNRVNSAELAVRQAGDKAIAAVAASDAFMPFADSLQTLAAAGVKAIIQPGGSMRDEEVIEAANLAGISIVFTGVRHFRH